VYEKPVLRQVPILPIATVRRSLTFIPFVHDQAGIG
jgi:hypothetical protein